MRMSTTLAKPTLLQSHSMLILQEVLTVHENDCLTYALS